MTEEEVRAIGLLEFAIEEAIVQLAGRTSSPLEIARRLIVVLGGPDDLSGDRIFEWVTARREM